MLDLRPVVHVVGILLLVLATAMLIPFAVSIAYGDGHWSTYVAAAAVTTFFGLAMTLSCTSKKRHTNLRHVFLLSSMGWLTLPIFAALPFAFGGIGLSYTDSFFESMSGLTTTGATILHDVEAAPPSLLIWRSTLQWLGGIGTVLMAVTILPILRVGGMQIFKTETFDSPAKIFSRLSPMAVRLMALYALLSLIWASLYWLAGMSLFDAFNHAMTTVSSGGFSTHDASFAYWQSSVINIIAIGGMIAAALPFALYLQAYRGAWQGLFTDRQVIVLLSTLACASLVIAVWLIVGNGYDIGKALMDAMFHTVSIVSTTGYSITDSQLWGGLPIALLFMLQYTGGCAGSATGGVKVFRLQVILAAARVQVARMLRPNLVVHALFGGRPLHASVDSVMAFFFLYAMCIGLLTVGLSLSGLDFTTAISGASAAISNVGIGLGDIIGPMGDFSTLPDSAKWQLAFGMVLGRLEILSLLVLFQPGFWHE